MKSSHETASGSDRERPQRGDAPLHAKQDESAPLPHEIDQQPESQHEDEPRGIGKRAHDDLLHGREDTDRRGGDDYQRRTQNDAQANSNAQRDETTSKDRARGKP